MRKVLSTLLIAGALVVAATSLASGATTKRCGTLYTPRCTKATITTRTLSASCKKPMSTLTLPSIKVHSIAGIRKITVSIGSTVLYTKKFKAPGPQNYTVKHLKVSAGGKGAHTVKIAVKDNVGNKSTHDVRFTTCASVSPVFTG